MATAIPGIPDTREEMENDLERRRRWTAETFLYEVLEIVKEPTSSPEPALLVLRDHMGRMPTAAQEAVLSLGQAHTELYQRLARLRYLLIHPGAKVEAHRELARREEFEG